MQTCKNCANYQPKGEAEGYCCGERLVPSDQSADECPDNEFTPKEPDLKDGVL